MNQELPWVRILLILDSIENYYPPLKKQLKYNNFRGKRDSLTRYRSKINQTYQFRKKIRP